MWTAPAGIEDSQQFSEKPCIFKNIRFFLIKKYDHVSVKVENTLNI